MIHLSGKRAILFIDGSNLYHNLWKYAADPRNSWKYGIDPTNIDMLKLSRLVCQKLGLDHVKTVYFNSIPSIADGKNAYFKHLAFLQGLRNQGIEVITRKLQRIYNTKQIEEKDQLLEQLSLCKDCKPKVKTHFIGEIGIVKREKGIDVAIAIDIIVKALNDEYDTCILISGDADLVPALETVKENWNKTVKSVFLDCNGFSSELKSKFSFMYLQKEDIEYCLKGQTTKI